MKTVTINASYTVGTETENKAVSISNNTAANSGGGIYHDRDMDGSALTVTGTETNKVTISGNRANGTGNGGGVFAYDTASRKALTPSAAC